MTKPELTIDRVVRLVNGSSVVATVTIVTTFGSEAIGVTSDGWRYRLYRADLFTDSGKLHCSGFQSLG